MDHSDQIQTRLQEHALETDRADLIGLLELRFGAMTAEVTDAVMQIDKLETLERLILVAANVPNWDAFQHELRIGDAAFKITGEDFNPLADRDSPSARQDHSGE